MSDTPAMEALHRFLRRLVVALPLSLGLLAAADRWAVPAFVWSGYLDHTALNQLERPPIDEGAGIADIHYLAAAYDCEAKDLWVTGPAPPASYWMIGLYDLRMRQVQGGHLNQRSVKLDGAGRFRIHVTDQPTGGDNELDCSTSPRGLLVVRILRPDGAFEDPRIE